MTNRNPYKINLLSGEELNMAAHPGGGVETIEVPSHEGIVEDLYETQMKMLEVATRQPIVAKLASLATALDDIGCERYASVIDAILIKKTAGWKSIAIPALVSAGAATGTVIVANTVVAIGSVGVGLFAVAAGAAGYAAGSLLDTVFDWIGKKTGISAVAALHSLFEDTPYNVAIENITSLLSQINDKTPLERADRILKRATSQMNAILLAPDVDDKEKEIILQMGSAVNSQAQLIIKGVQEYKASHGGVLPTEQGSAKSTTDQRDELTLIFAKRAQEAVNKINELDKSITLRINQDEEEAKRIDSILNRLQKVITTFSIFKKILLPTLTGETSVNPKDREYINKTLQSVENGIAQIDSAIFQ